MYGLLLTMLRKALGLSESRNKQSKKCERKRERPRLQKINIKIG